MNESWSVGRGVLSVLFFSGASALSFACGDGSGEAKSDTAASGAPAAKPAKADGSAKPAAAPPPTAKAADAAPAAKGDAPAPQAVTAPEQQSYPLGNIKAIPDSCSNAHVILANAPASVGVDYAWQYSKQAMLANQQFKTGSSATAPGQVSFAVHQGDASMAEAFALVATCADGSTCNRLASMYKAVVKSSNPQVLCGDVPKALALKKKIDLLAGDPASNVPAASDTIGKCARVAACTIASKPDTTDDVGIQCQKAPTKFKTECATKYPCAEVMACLGQ